MSSGLARRDGAKPLPGLKRPGAWICALGLALCLMGCQPRANTASLPPPPPPVSVPPLPRAVRPTLYVTVNHLNLRSCPGTDCPKAATLNLNAEVEKMGEIKDWTQIKVKKDGSIGYVSSRFLSPQPVQVAKHARKRTKQAKLRKAAQPVEAVQKEREVEPMQQGASAPIPRVM